MTISTPVSTTDDHSHNEDLLAFLKDSSSPYHAVAQAARRLEKAGFTVSSQFKQDLKQRMSTKKP